MFAEWDPCGTPTFFGAVMIVAVIILFNVMLKASENAIKEGQDILADEKKRKAASEIIRWLWKK